jgi:integrase
MIIRDPPAMERAVMPRLALIGEVGGGGLGAHRRSMTRSNELIPVPSGRPVPFADQLRLAVAAYLARFTGSSRDHADSDLRCYLTWCAERGLDPLAATRPHLELYIRWMQEICRFKPSTVSRRFSVTAGFYRTCVIDGVRHTFVTTMLDAGVDLRDVQIAARHADPRTTMRYAGPFEARRTGPSVTTLADG